MVLASPRRTAFNWYSLAISTIFFSICVPDCPEHFEREAMFRSPSFMFITISPSSQWRVIEIRNGLEVIFASGKCFRIVLRSSGEMGSEGVFFGARRNEVFDKKSFNPERLIATLQG
jgi:hypothetical protein